VKITEVRVKLMENSDDRLQAFCSITFDDAFVVRDLKVIEGSNGPFVAMPSRKLTAHCPECGCKNHLRAGYCNQCGERLYEDRALRDQEGRVKLYADIAHPIHSECREMIQSRVIAEYQAERERAKEPGYISRYDDEYDAGDDVVPTEPERRAEPVPTAGRGEPALPTGPGGRTQQIQPPEVEPRGPHKLPHEQPARRSQQSARRSDETDRGSRGDQFGAGIFDE
jgi:stage V sporulation protein G